MNDDDDVYPSLYRVKLFVKNITSSINRDLEGSSRGHFMKIDIFNGKNEENHFGKDFLWKFVEWWSPIYWTEKNEWLRQTEAKNWNQIYPVKYREELSEEATARSEMKILVEFKCTSKRGRKSKSGKRKSVHDQKRRPVEIAQLSLLSENSCSFHEFENRWK